ncbi:MAG TPA: hypothetical protein VLM89_15005, partial [Phycisphaerae bacterium]|nr:hypothetical protein [Phycisphaerae bacterium]
VVITAGTAPQAQLDNPGQWSGLGTSVEFIQRLEEVNRVRVVVMGEWRFGSPGAPTSESSPYHRWLYSVYSDGRVYVECRGTARSATFEPPGLGLVFACDGNLGFTRHVVSSGPFVLFSRPEPDQGDLLVVPARPLMPQTLRSVQDPRLCVLWRTEAVGEQFVFAGLIRIWPNDLDSPDKAARYAADYSRPLPIALDAGQLVRTDDGDYDNDGFSEARGYYVLQLDGNVAKVRIDGQRLPRFSPIFRVVDVTQRDVWVYLNGRQIKDTCRTPQGDVLFMVPGMIAGEVLLEVNAGPRQGSETR